MQKMSLHEALYPQRAIRNFTPYPVSDDTVATILDAAVRAPNGSAAKQELLRAAAPQCHHNGHLAAGNGSGNGADNSSNSDSDASDAGFIAFPVAGLLRVTMKILPFFSNSTTAIFSFFRICVNVKEFLNFRQLMNLVWSR